MTFAECVVVFILVATICVWFSMRPQFIKGWADYIPYGKYVRWTCHSGFSLFRELKCRLFT